MSPNDSLCVRVCASCKCKERLMRVNVCVRRVSVCVMCEQKKRKAGHSVILRLVD